MSGSADSPTAAVVSLEACIVQMRSVLSCDADASKSFPSARAVLVNTTSCFAILRWSRSFPFACGPEVTQTAIALRIADVSKPVPKHEQRGDLYSDGEQYKAMRI